MGMWSWPRMRWGTLETPVKSSQTGESVSGILASIPSNFLSRSSCMHYLHCAGEYQAKTGKAWRVPYPPAKAPGHHFYKCAAGERLIPVSRTVLIFFIRENVIDPHPEDVGNPVCKDERRAVPSLFDGYDGVPGNPSPVGQGFLGHVPFGPEHLDPVLHRDQLFPAYQYFLR